MAKTSRTKTSKSNTSEKDLQAEVQDYSGGLSNYNDFYTEDSTNREISDDDESTEERDEVPKIKDKNSGKDSMKTPTRKNDSKYPTPPEYLVKKKPKGICERKGDDSDEEEESTKSKKKPQYDGSSDPDKNDNGGDDFSSNDSDDDSNQDDARDVTNPNEAW